MHRLSVDSGEMAIKWQSIGAETVTAGDLVPRYRQDHDLGADADALIEVADVLVGQPDAA